MGAVWRQYRFGADAWGGSGARDSTGTKVCTLHLFIQERIGKISNQNPAFKEQGSPRHCAEGTRGAATGT